MHSLKSTGLCSYFMSDFLSTKTPVDQTLNRAQSGTSQMQRSPKSRNDQWLRIRSFRMRAFSCCWFDGIATHAACRNPQRDATDGSAPKGVGSDFSDGLKTHCLIIIEGKASFSQKILQVCFAQHPSPIAHSALHTSCYAEIAIECIIKQQKYK